jgi:hypothetical protein
MSSAHRSPEGTDVRAKENDNGAGILNLEPNNGAVNEGPYAI